ncbi:dienelactone hydrolase [Zopfochytrium polystomum]|nr:dienelactone hydrolase [Zopfochytrium polystomum]
MADVPECCRSGFVWQGTPTGSIETIGGVEAYVARPKTPSTHFIVILTDVFGHGLPNVRLIADSVAACGFNCVVPDILNGDPLADFMDKAPSSSASSTILGTVTKAVRIATTVVPSMLMWFPRHTDALTLPPVIAVLEDVRRRLGATKVGTIGYCFGGRYSILMGATDRVDAFAAAHPSNVTHKDLAAVVRPGLLCLAEKEFMRNGMIAVDQAPEVERLLSAAENPERAGRPPVLLKGFKGTTHGFAVRGDEDDPVVRMARNDALASMLEFFKSAFGASHSTVKAQL